VTVSSEPIRRLAPAETGELVARLRRMAVDALARMYRPGERLFAHHLRREGGLDVLEGVSARYTATALIGLAGEADCRVAAALAGQDPVDVCGALIGRVGQFVDLGEVALTLWAGRVLDHPDVPKALQRLREMAPVGGSWPTVEMAWSLTALVVESSSVTDAALARALADRLIDSFDPRSELFHHRPRGAGGSGLRSHVTCFADFVYPVQALSLYHLAGGNGRALEVASRCAHRMCTLQGPAGQWWWHFDVRTGRALERFPVYSVHQDSMAPMALHALKRAGGPDHSDPVRRGLDWLACPPERDESLIDLAAGIIWRKIARREPHKLVRGLQAAASRIHPAIRVPAADLLFAPTRVDHESRPYHMGWILHAWPKRQGWPA